MRKNRKGRKEEKYDIDRVHGSFSANMKGLRTFVTQLTPVVKKHDVDSLKKVVKDIEKVFKTVGISESELRAKKIKKTKLKLTQEQENQILAVAKNLVRHPPLPLHNLELLHKSTFVMLISYLDFLISDLIHYYYQVYPRSLSGKDLSITLNELNVCSNLGEARDFIVNKEVESVLYRSLPEQRKYFSNQLKIDCKENIINWNKINEAVERRNIIVHNNSIINRRYLKNVDLSFVPGKRKDLKEGEKIVIDEDYFAGLFDEIFVAGTILIQCCWRKWKKDDINEANVSLRDSVYDALLEERWAIAERLGLFSKECDVGNQSNRLCLEINYWQSLKWQNKKDELEKELKRFDVSGLSPRYALALCALKSDRDGFYKNVKKAIITDKLTKEDLMEWPLFREFRRDPDFEKRIKRVFRSVSTSA